MYIIKQKYYKEYKMAVPAALAVMGALSAVSSIGSAISNSQNAKEQLKLQQDAFDFVKQMNEENKAMWAAELSNFESMFGDIERTLSTYYNDMTADKAITSGMQELAKSYSAAKADLNAELAQRGLSTSGAAAASATNLASSKALAEANLRKNAQSDVMAAKQSWYNTGLAQKNAALQGYSGALARSANTGMSLAGNFGAAANAYGNAASNAMSSLGSSIGSIASAGLKYGAMGSGVDSGSTSGTAMASNKLPSSIYSSSPYYDTKTNTIVNPDTPWYMKNWKGGN